MKAMRTIWKKSVTLLFALLLFSSMTVCASGYSDDNSLSDLGIEDAVDVVPDFSYDVTSYDVTMPEGSTEVNLEPTTSNSAASYDISGTTLDDTGKGTVTITVTAESGLQAVYTLNVSSEHPNAAAQIAAAAESATEAVTEVQTETVAQTEAATEAQTETETEAASGVAGLSQKLTSQVNGLMEDTTMTMKVMYGLIAFCVILLFFIINLLIKNRDLRDDLRELEEKLELQTNEFARKEQYMATENYYAPVQQQAAMGMNPQQIPSEPEKVAPQQIAAAPKVEEAFGAVTQEQPTPKPARNTQKRDRKNDVDIKMIDL